MKMRPFVTAAKIGLLMLLAQGGVAVAAEVKVLAATAMRPVMNELGPQFERATGHKLVIQSEVIGVLKRQIDAGESFDVTILTPPLIDDLIKQGKVAAGTRADIARSGMGVLIRAGAPKADIKTPDAFKRAMLDARSIAYGKDTPYASYVPILFARLGIDEQMKSKTKLLEGGAAASPAALTNGEAELVFVIISAVHPAPMGTELLGPLPAELQNYAIYAAGIGAATKEGEAAKALINFLKAPAAAAVLQAKGMEPVEK